MRTIGKTPNRKAQAITTALAVTGTAVATGGLGFVVAGAGAVVWWVTGKLTNKYR